MSDPQNPSEGVRRFHDGAQDGLEPVRPLEIRDVRSISDLVNQMKSTAFGGRQVGEAAIAQLRAQGPAGLDKLRKAHRPLIRKVKDASRRSLSIQEQARFARLRRAIDKVAAQRDAYVQGLYWYTDLEAAQAAAVGQGRPILSLRMLGRRAYACGELADRLAAKGHDATLVQRVVRRLAECGLLDDEAYARELAEATIEKKPGSAALIRQTLEARRVPPEIAERVADEVARWRKPLWPVVAVCGVVIVGAAWLGLVMGGFIAAPGWLESAWQWVFRR